MNSEKTYDIFDIIGFSYGLMDYVHIEQGKENFYGIHFALANGTFHGLQTRDEKLKYNGELWQYRNQKINSLPDDDYLQFLKECDIYIYNFIGYSKCL